MCSASIPTYVSWLMFPFFNQGTELDFLGGKLYLTSPGLRSFGSTLK